VTTCTKAKHRWRGRIQSLRWTLVSPRRVADRYEQGFDQCTARQNQGAAPVAYASGTRCSASIDAAICERGRPNGRGWQTDCAFTGKEIANAIRARRCVIKKQNRSKEICRTDTRQTTRVRGIPRGGQARGNEACSREKNSAVNSCRQWVAR